MDALRVAVLDTGGRRIPATSAANGSRLGRVGPVRRVHGETVPEGRLSGPVRRRNARGLQVRLCTAVPIMFSGVELH